MPVNIPYIYRCICSRVHFVVIWLGTCWKTGAVLELWRRSRSLQVTLKYKYFLSALKKASQRFHPALFQEFFIVSRWIYKLYDYAVQFQPTKMQRLNWGVQTRSQDLHKHLIWKALQQNLTVKNRYLLLKSFPSLMFSGVLTTPQVFLYYTFCVSNIKFLKNFVFLQVLRHWVGYITPIFDR